jgi:hypothetical protein
MPRLTVEQAEARGHAGALKMVSAWFPEGTEPTAAGIHDALQAERVARREERDAQALLLRAAEQERDAALAEVRGAVVIPVGMPIREAIKLIVQANLRAEGGNQTNTARRLGLARRTLLVWLSGRWPFPGIRRHRAPSGELVPIEEVSHA